MRLSVKIAMVLCLLIPSTAHAIHFKTDTGFEINSEKVAMIDGPLTAAAAFKYQRTSLDTFEHPGDRIVLINSPGGYVEVGNDILRMIDAERKAGVRIVCLVDRQASSMAFNILTHCDVRLATAKSHMLVHKIRTMSMACPNSYGCTAAMMRTAASELDKLDEPYRQANAAAMHLSLKDYDLFADQETVWAAPTLRKSGYLHGIATVLN